MTVQSVALGALVEDFSIYPRHAVDPSHVGQIAEALRVGEHVPPPVVEKGSLRIADGWHRVRAYQRVFGSDAKIDVDVRAFKTHTELVRFAVDANMAHGRRLDRIDRVRCALLLREVGLPADQIAVTLRVRQPVLEKMVLQVSPIPAGSNGGAVPGTNQLPLKRAAAHFAGQPLSREQVLAHGTLPGTSLSLLAKQLTSAIRAGFVDAKNERLRLALVELHQVLSTFLAAPMPVGEEVEVQ